MNLQEIKNAVNAGKKVHWSHEGYEVRKDEKLNEYNIICLSNNDCIGLTHMNGVTMNGKEEQFFILNDSPAPRSQCEEAKKLLDKMSPEQLLEYCYQYGVTHNPAGTDAAFKAAIIENFVDDNEAKDFCNGFDEFIAFCKANHSKGIVGEAERREAIQNREVKSLDDIFEQDKPENGGQGLLEDNPLLAALKRIMKTHDRVMTNDDPLDIAADMADIAEKAVKEHEATPSPAPSDSDSDSDSEIKKLWESLTDIPFDEDEDNVTILAQEWNDWDVGTPREDIWHWFDENHSKGVAYLMGLTEEATASPTPSSNWGKNQGWWSINFEGVEPSECSLEHVAKLVTEGYTSGEIIEHDDEEVTT